MAKTTPNPDYSARIDFTVDHEATPVDIDEAVAWLSEWNRVKGPDFRKEHTDKHESA